MARIAVVAIGGNSLISDPKNVSIASQYAAVAETCSHLANLIDAGYEIVVTHGNGPQVGYILQRAEYAQEKLGLHPVPLDSCGADTQGAIGYQIQMAMNNELRRRGLKKVVTTVVTQVLVDKDDPAFQAPSKPIGRFYTEAEAKALEAEQGWAVKEDSGRGWRRVVASPRPVEVIELDAIRTLLDAGTVVVAVGGGGIPVVRNAEGDLVGNESVIDKDFASALLATKLGADLLVISTAIEKAYLGFGTPEQKGIPEMSVAQAKAYIAEKQFKPGSMLPKVQAAIQFIEAGGSKVIITDPASVARALRGETGTAVVP
jgi:carbamate kinase